MIKAVSQSIEIPLLVGGGISTPEQALKACNAGADLIVIGNAIERNPSLIKELSAAIHYSQNLLR
jgi:putative glycerol-1-phosphate prenyltransferase